MRKSGILMPWTRASEALLPLTFWDRQFFVVWAFYGFYTIAASLSSTHCLLVVLPSPETRRQKCLRRCHLFSGAQTHSCSRSIAVAGRTLQAEGPLRGSIHCMFGVE